MPIYEYKCSACNETFSLIRRMGAGTEGLSCPACKSGEITKLLSLTCTPDSEKALPSSFESAAAKMPDLSKGGGGGCSGGMCGSGMCGI